MTTMINTADVPEVDVHELYVPMRTLIEQGRGLALLNGVSEADLRGLESELWANFKGSDASRLAVALRFRALLDVVSSRRLKQLHLERGFKFIAAAIAVAATQRLNTRYGFRPQNFVARLSLRTVQPIVHSTDFRLAA